MELADLVLAGDPRAIARAISVVENEPGQAPELIRCLFDQASHAKLVGVTGAPGVGKSTLADKLTTEWRRDGLSVGILAIDPTSPSTGGAILGDRIRLQTHAKDDAVYVRSMATRGHLGGVAQAASDAAVIMAAAGKDVILIETVGVGQGEVDIARTADISIVVIMPGAGDDVQMLKAGVMEIADIFVVNKADCEGADRAVGELKEMISLREHSPGAWRPPVLKTRATTGDGVKAVVDALRQFEHEVDGGSRRRARARFRLCGILRQAFIERFEQPTPAGVLLSEAVDEIAGGTLDPYTAADQIMQQVL